MEGTGSTEYMVVEKKGMLALTVGPCQRVPKIPYSPPGCLRDANPEYMLLLLQAAFLYLSSYRLELAITRPSLAAVATAAPR